MNLLSITTPDLETFIRFIQDRTGISPFKGVDSSGMNPKDPASYVGSLDLKNEPLEAIRDQNGILGDHYHMSFIMEADEEQLASLVNTRLRFLVHQNKKSYIVIFTGSLNDIISTIIYACATDHDDVLKKIMAEVLQILEQTRLREMLSGYTKQYMRDGSYILVKR